MAKAIGLGIVGFGNIGAGVVDVLTCNAEVINSRLPRPIKLIRLADKDLETPRPVAIPEGVEFTDEAAKVLSSPDIDIVIELVGGLNPARKFVETALRAGKHVVTANKALLADCGAELWEIADSMGVSLLFEAAVGGGIPIIRALQQGLAANEISSVRGILNGTCNYILTTMAKEGRKFADVLEDAKRLGYAEPDPTFDIEGYDTAHKIAILASLAFGQDVRFSDVFVEGIVKVHADDLALAAELDHTVKLLAVAKRSEKGEPIEVRVHPAMIPLSAPLGRIDGVLNAVEVVGNAVGPVLLTGAGAGPGPTASAVLSDVMNLAQQIADGGASLDKRLRVPAGERQVRPAIELASARCFSLNLLDQANAKADIRKAFADAGIEVVETHERTRLDGEYQKIAILTSAVGDDQVGAVLRSIAALNITVEQPSVLRVEEM